MDPESQISNSACWAVGRRPFAKAGAGSYRKVADEAQEMMPFVHDGIDILSLRWVKIFFLG